MEFNKYLERFTQNIAVSCISASKFFEIYKEKTQQL